MTLSSAQIAEFQTLYKRHFDAALSDAEALDKGLRLIRLTEAVGRTLSHEVPKYENDYDENTAPGHQ